MAAIDHAMEINHCRGMERIEVKRAHRHLGEKGQRAFRADDGVGDDVKRIIVSHERSDVETCHVLDGIFPADAVGEGLVGPHLVAQSLYTFDEIAMGLAEQLTAMCIAGVEHRAVGKNDAHRQQHVVGVGMHAATHTGGVVDDDATHHRTVDGGRVGGEEAPHRLQNPVDATADKTRLHGDGVVVIADVVILPMLAGDNQYGVAHALARQRGAGGSKREWNMIGGAALDDLRHFLLIVRTYHHLWHHVIKTGVGTPTKGTQLVGIYTVVRDDMLQLLQ